eukprot:13224105-Alexandrium_andersonii.AAC.1
MLQLSTTAQPFFGSPDRMARLHTAVLIEVAGRCRPPRQARVLVQPPACECQLAHGLARAFRLAAAV